MVSCLSTLWIWRSKQAMHLMLCLSTLSTLVFLEYYELWKLLSSNPTFAKFFSNHSSLLGAQPASPEHEQFGSCLRTAQWWFTWRTSPTTPLWICWKHCWNRRKTNSWCEHDIHRLRPLDRCSHQAGRMLSPTSPCWQKEWRVYCSSCSIGRHPSWGHTWGRLSTAGRHGRQPGNMVQWWVPYWPLPSHPDQRTQDWPLLQLPEGRSSLAQM